MARKSGRRRPQNPRSFWPQRLTAFGTPTESLRIERVIAVARLFLTAIAFVAIDLDPIVPAIYEPVAYVLLIFFAAHSIAALIVLRRRQRTTRSKRSWCRTPTNGRSPGTSTPSATWGTRRWSG